MEGFEEILEAVDQAVRSIPDSVLSIWVAIQVGLIAVAALLGWAMAVYARRRINILPYITQWPAVLRQAIRVSIDNLGIIICIVILVLMRIAMQALTLPARSYLIGVAREPCHRLDRDRNPREPDPQRLHQPRGVGGRVVGRGAQHRRAAG